MKLAMRMAELASRGYIVVIEQHPANEKYIQIKLNKNGFSRRAYFNYEGWKENEVIDALKRLETGFDEFFKTQQRLANEG